MLNDSDLNIIAISREITELRLSVDRLQKQLPITVSELQTTIEKNSHELTESIQRLTMVVDKYSKSNDHYATSMQWLTFGLLVIGLVPIIQPLLIRLFEKIL